MVAVGFCFFDVKSNTSQGWGIYFSHSASFNTLFAIFFWIVFFTIIILYYANIKEYVIKKKIDELVKGILYHLPFYWKLVVFIHLSIFSFNFIYDLVLFFYLSLPSIHFIWPSFDSTLFSNISKISFCDLQQFFDVYLYSFDGFNYEYMGQEIGLANSPYNSSSDLICMATNGQGGSSNITPVTPAEAWSSPNYRELRAIADEYYTVRQDLISLASKAMRGMTPAEQALERSVINDTLNQFHINHTIRPQNNLLGMAYAEHAGCRWLVSYTRRTFRDYLSTNDLNQLREIDSSLTNCMRDLETWTR